MSIWVFDGFDIILPTFWIWLIQGVVLLTVLLLPPVLVSGCLFVLFVALSDFLNLDGSALNSFLNLRDDLESIKAASYRILALVDLVFKL